MAAVIDTLREEHRNIGRLLDALEYQMQVFGRAGVPDYDIIRSIADYFLDYPDTCHHPKEDVVFRRLRERCAQDAAAVDELLGEHREMHERARWFRDTVHALLSESDIARDAVVDAARVFIETERRHMAKEEERFFPLAESRLTPEDWARIQDELVGRRDPLFGDRVEEEFRGLRERLLVWEREYRKDEAMVANPDSSTAAEGVVLRRSHREEGGWELFAHGSDIGVRGFGKTRETAFEEAAYALTSVITDAGSVESNEAVDAVCNAPNDDVLLYEWLNALIYEMAARDMLFGRYSVQIHDHGLTGKAWGEQTDVEKHQPAVEVKGATMTELGVSRDTDGYWMAQCVVDV